MQISPILRSKWMIFSAQMTVKTTSFQIIITWLNWLIVYCLSSRSIICSALIFAQKFERIFIEPYLLSQEASVFAVSSKRMLHLLALEDNIKWYSPQATEIETENINYLRIYRPCKNRLVIDPLRTRFKRSIHDDLATIITSIW